MTTVAHQTLAPTSRGVHRGSVTATASTGLARRAARRLWQALEDIGRARAQVALRDLADRYERQEPALAAQLRAASLQPPHR